MQESIGDITEPAFDFAIVRKHGLAANVRRCRDQRRLEPVEQQLMQRAIRQKGSDLAQSRCDIFGQVAVIRSCRKYDGPCRACQQRCLDIVKTGVLANEIQTISPDKRKHDRQRFVRPVFALSQQVDRIGVARAAHQVITTDALHGNNRSCTQCIKRGFQCSFPAYSVSLRINKLQLRSTRRTRDWLRMKASIRGIQVLLFTLIAK